MFGRKLGSREPISGQQIKSLQLVLEALATAPGRGRRGSLNFQTINVVSLMPLILVVRIFKLPHKSH
jgi:hypothetical protein